MDPGKELLLCVIMTDPTVNSIESLGMGKIFYICVLMAVDTIQIVMN